MARHAAPWQAVVGMGLLPPPGLLPGAGELPLDPEPPQSSPLQTGACGWPSGIWLTSPPEPLLDGVEPLPDPPQSSPSQEGEPEPPLPPLGVVDPVPEPPQSSPSHAGACDGVEPEPPVVVAGAGDGGPGVPSCASHPQGSVMVTVVGVLSQTVQTFSVTVKPWGMWLGPGVHVGWGSVQLSVTVYVLGTMPVGQSDMYVVVYVVVYPGPEGLVDPMPSHSGQKVTVTPFVTVIIVSMAAVGHSSYVTVVYETDGAGLE